ncbi:glycosyltransferase [Nitratidesulfovibrio vulgaris]|uniref:glycosyltransferase n=1 Tax=Nitratidesulfovibrio vulgaris TaxID=881 RepID=UPI002301EFA4|nr:glycosyltransferase [Nitratidesulfovibrio vulgaris]WCB46369.1 glycosyltransferase [Nitratidesulfovibrio vulgaris]
MNIALFIKDTSGVTLRDFIADIVAYLGREHEVRVCTSVNEADIARLCQWAHVAWVEWLAEHAEAVCRRRRPCRVLARVHSYEAYSGHPEAINWNNLDVLVAVADHVLALLEARVPRLRDSVRTVVIPNGLHMDRFPARQPRPATKRLAWVGTLRHTKNFPLALQCLHALRQRDPEWTLHVAGDYPAWSDVEAMENLVYNQHMAATMGLEGAVNFYGNVADMPAWYADKDALLSTSIRESFGYAIAEATATGLKPVIHAFPGARNIWPAEWLFASVNECVQLLLDKTHNPAALREFVRKRYGLARQLAAVDVLLRELAAEGPAVSTPAAPGQTAPTPPTPPTPPAPPAPPTQDAPQPGGRIGSPDPVFSGVAGYWDSRYASGGNSGAGSYGRLAAFKARILNDFVASHAIGSVIEFGCGDGNQLTLAHYPSYTGLDISANAVALCRNRHGHDLTKRFLRYEPDDFPQGNPWVRAELALSLDVIFHIVEDHLFEAYMRHLFDSATRYVIVYSSNTSDNSGVAHVRHRKFTRWVRTNRKDFTLESFVPNEHPFDPAMPDETSFSDFYIFKRVE